MTVLLVAPAAALAGILSLRGHPAGPLLALGPAAYAAYMFVQYVLGPEYDHYSLAVLLGCGTSGRWPVRSWARWPLWAW